MSDDQSWKCELFDRHKEFAQQLGYAGVSEALHALQQGPQTGSWIAAEDVHRLVRQIDVALNGEEGAAPQAMLCDITAQVVAEARRRGGPLLSQGNMVPIGTVEIRSDDAGWKMLFGLDEAAKHFTVGTHTLYARDDH